MKTKRFKKVKGFTLVELMVVIGIVSILAVVGGLTVTQFVGDGRDARIKADLTNIAKGLEIYHVENREYPLPTNATGSTVLQGEWGSGNTEDVLFEPHSKQSDGTNFIYTVTADQQNYSIAGWINGEEISYNNLIGEKVYAAGRNYKGMKLFKIGNIDIPIIVNRDTWEPVNKSNYGDFGSYEGLNEETETATYSDGAEELSGSNLTEMLTKSAEYLEENGTTINTGPTTYTLSSCPSVSDDGSYTRDEVFANLDVNNGGTESMIGCIINNYGSTNEDVDIVGLTQDKDGNKYVLVLSANTHGSSWGCYGKDLTLDNITDGSEPDWDGKHNTPIIANECGEGVAKSCLDMGNGWYLPAKNELTSIYINRDKFRINNTISYRSSTEAGSNGARLYDFGDYRKYSNSKYVGYRVACVNRF